MEKYYLTTNGKEVKVGDAITKKSIMKNKYGEGIVVENYKVTENLIPILLEEGIIVSKPHPENCECNMCKASAATVPMDLNYYIMKLAERMNWKTDKVSNYLNSIHEIYPAAAFSIILREIAIELDKQYENHIKNSPEIWVISMFDGRIAKVTNKAIIKNYKNFAAFRSLEDARIACRIVKHVLKDMFKDGKQKDKKCPKADV